MDRSPLLRALPLLWVLALVVVMTSGLLSGCERSSSRQHLDNPFDPDGTLGGDALQVRALARDNGVLLTWTQPQGLDIVDYVILRSDSRDGPYEEIAVVAHTAAATSSFNYEFPAPTQAHWFTVQAVNATGGVSQTSLAVPATMTVGPTVVVGDTLSDVATRYLEISVTVGFGDTLLVGLDESFSAPLRVPVTGPGLPTVFTFDLGPAAFDSTFSLHVKAFDDLGESAPTVVSLPVDFEPKQALLSGSPLRLATRVIDLKIPATGVVNMRFAASEDALADAVWVPGAETFLGYELSDVATSQAVWGEFESDFGFSTKHELEVRPDLLLGASFRLQVPESRFVTSSTVVAAFTAAATEMRVSENPNFAAVPWQAFRDTVNFQLSAGEGTKTVYAQYRNDWTQSAIFSDYCIFLSQGLDVTIIAPSDGDVVIGGSTLLVVGTGNPGTVATSLDSVRLDLGDGAGFREVIGTDNWQTNWAVPLFEEDTEVVLRARAWADSARFMVTDVVTVTVSQLSLTIVEPGDGAMIVGGEPLIISGTASGILNGAPVDSVVVDVADEHLVANGTTDWSATWLTPTVAADTPFPIAATLWTDGETLRRTISVTVTKAP